MRGDNKDVGMMWGTFFCIFFFVAHVISATDVNIFTKPIGIDELARSCWDLAEDCGVSGLPDEIKSFLLSLDHTIATSSSYTAIRLKIGESAAASAASLPDSRSKKTRASTPRRRSRFRLCNIVLGRPCPSKLRLRLHC